MPSLWILGRAIGGIFTFALSHPLVYFGQFETKQSADLVRGETLLVYPAIYRVFVDAEM